MSSPVHGGTVRQLFGWVCVLSALLRASLDQGQFRADLDVPRVLDAATVAVYLRLLLSQTLKPAWVKQLADAILEGCYPGISGSASCRKNGT